MNPKTKFGRWVHAKELGRDFDPRRNLVSLWYHFAPWLRHQEKIRKPNPPLPLRGPFASQRGARPRAPADASGKMHLTTEGERGGDRI